MKRPEPDAMNTIVIPNLCATLAVMLVAAAWAAPTVAAPSLQSADAAQLWPRLFYSPAQRRAIEQARLPAEREAISGTTANTGIAGSTAPSEPARFVLQGMAQGRRAASAWINGTMLEQGDTIAGRTVQIEAQVVRLRLAGQPDIVLRPGQQGSEAGQAVQDIVPPGSFHKK